MIINKLVFPIKSDLSFVEGGIPQGMLTANSINRDILYVISPAVKETVITAFFQNQKQTEDTQQATFVLSDLSIDYLVSKDTSYYELVKDWNVWQTQIPSKALEFISYNRAGKIGISFAFKQLLEPSGYEGSQEITNDNFVINDSGSYIIKVPYYHFLDNDFTYNDVLIYNGESEVSKKPAIALQGTTGTLEYSVDPSVYMGGYESVEIGLTESILSKLGENSGEIKLLRLKFNNYYTIEEVDGLILNTQEEIDNISEDLHLELANKVDKITQEQRDSLGFMENDDRIVPGVDGNLNEMPIKATARKEKNTIVMRDINGNFQDLYDHNTSPTAHSNEFNKKVDKTQTIIGIDLQDNILLGEFKQALGNATQSVAGLLSAEDKTHLDGLVALLETNDDNNVVDTIGEILAIFQNYPEGADLVTVLQGKVDKEAGKGLSENDLTDELKDNYDTAYAHSQIVGANPHQTTYAQLLNKPTTIEQAGILNVYNKEYIDTLKDKNGWESELLGTLSNNETIALSIINQYDEIQMYAKDTLGVIDNENIRPSLMQSGDSVYFFDDTQAFIMVDTVFGFYAPVGYTLQVVGIKYTELKAIDTTYDNTESEMTATTVQGAIDELDTQVKGANDDIALRVKTSDIVNDLVSTDVDKPLSANQGKVLQDTKENLSNKATNFETVNDTRYPSVKAVKDQLDTTAKLAESNVFTQPQQVPNATLPQHTTNKLQVETMFEMFKRELRGYNLAMPDLEDKEYLGDGVYRLYNENGITIDYNVYNGHWVLNGQAVTSYTIPLSSYNDIGLLTGNMIIISGSYIDTGSGGWRFGDFTTTEGRIYFNGGIGGYIKTYEKIEVLSNVTLSFVQGSTYDNFTFKLQLEKGDTATPYTVPGKIPAYKIVGEE